MTQRDQMRFNVSTEPNQPDKNYDSPWAFDFKRKIQLIQAVKQGQFIEVKEYDHSSHGHRHADHKEVPRIIPGTASYLFVSGILSFYAGPEIGEDPYELFDSFDHRSYIQFDLETAKHQRLTRDAVGRNRPLDEAAQQQADVAVAMHQKYAFPIRDHPAVDHLRGWDVTHIKDSKERRDAIVNFIWRLSYDICERAGDTTAGLTRLSHDDLDAAGVKFYDLGEF